MTDIAIAAPERQQREGLLSMFAQVSRLHIIAIACLACLTFGWLMTGEYVWLAPIVCAIDWFIVNLVNRVVDLAEDRANGIVGTDFVSRHGKLLEIGCLALLVGSVAGMHFLAPAMLWVRVVFHAIGLAYNYKLLPAPKGRTRFKEVYFFKNFSSGVLFILSTVLLPMVLSGANPSPLWLAAIIGFFLPLELTYEIFYDLRDIEGDRALAVPTFPVVHGEAGSYAIIWALLGLSAASIVAGGLAGVLRLKEIALIGGVVQQAIYFHFFIRKAATKERCIFITWLGAAQIFAYHVWIFAGLPTEL